MEEHPIKEFISRFVRSINQGGDVCKSIREVRQPLKYLIDVARSGGNFKGIYGNWNRFDRGVVESHAALMGMFGACVRTLLEHDGILFEIPECLAPVVEVIDIDNGAMGVDGYVHSSFIGNGEPWAVSGNELIPNITLAIPGWESEIDMSRVILFAEYYTSEKTTIRIIPDVTARRYYVFHLDYTNAEGPAPAGHATVLNFFYFTLDDVVSVYGSKTVMAAFTRPRESDVDADGNPSEALSKLHKTFVPYEMVH